MPPPLGFNAPEAMPLLMELEVTALPLLTADATVKAVVKLRPLPPERPDGGADEIVVARDPLELPLLNELTCPEREMVAGVDWAYVPPFDGIGSLMAQPRVLFAAVTP